jgi:hypothetical protein
MIRLLIIAAVALFLVLYIRTLVDIFTRRRDLSGTAKAAWAILLLILPFIGLLVYTMLRPADSQIARRT